MYNLLQKSKKRKRADDSDDGSGEDEGGKSTSPMRLSDFLRGDGDD